MDAPHPNHPTAVARQGEAVVTILDLGVELAKRLFHPHAIDQHRPGAVADAVATGAA
jgi:hypothetical protein